MLSSSSTELLPRWPMNAGVSLNASGMSLFLKRNGWRTMARQRPGAMGTPYTAAGSTEMKKQAHVRRAAE